MRPRVPEPMVMDDPAAVLAFDAAHPVLQAPIYRLNAVALSRLLPEGGSLLDLGSGTGRLLIELARARPDVRISGRELAPTMVEVGRAALDAAGVADRVTLATGDMTAVDEVPESVDVISCVWALHHLPAHADVERALRGIAQIRERTGAAVWIFDFARLEDDATFAGVLDAVPGISPRLYEDAVASERAAWTADELADMLRSAGLDDLSGGAEARIGHLQAWASAPAEGATKAHETLWRADPLPSGPGQDLEELLSAGLPAARAS